MKYNVLVLHQPSQAIPLLKAEAPLVGTGVEAIAARDSGAVVIAKATGTVDYVDSKKIIVKTMGGMDLTFGISLVNSSGPSLVSRHSIW